VFGGFGPQNVEEDDDEEDEPAEAEQVKAEEDMEEDEPATFGWFNDIYILDAVSLNWEKKEISGIPPSPRAAFGMIALKEKIFIFGGRDNSQRVNDLHIFDTTSFNWIQPKVRGSKPSPRSFHSLTTIGQNAILFGGLNRSNTHLNDIHILSFCEEEICWLQPKVEGDEPPARGFHTAFIVGDQFYIFGGSSNFDSTIHECTRYYNDLYCFDISSIQLGTQILFPNPHTTETNNM